ncbi:ornithine carbamoyltransferase [Anaerocaecibacter muris]|uniref:ornithine carbamoyltransferase n=1 Tax=Anaerocaecibacter muris TaxID=2941513 RepID=UPI00203E1157|nr:ornithine carbamoyltransferase [Anaerocaecibacter muris]
MDVSSYKPKGRIEHKHLLNLLDYSAADIYEILHLSNSLKTAFHRGKKHELLKNKTLAMIFTKSSTRTRVSFEMGIKQLGGNSLFLSSNDIQLGRGETIHDTACVLSRYGIDGVMIRTFKQSDVEELAKYGSFSVINGLTDDFHPCQALADIFTLYETYGQLNGVKLAYFGDGNNMAHSLMLAGAKTGMNVCICAPKGFQPNPEITEAAQKFGNVTVTDNVEEAATDADALYTDVFFSMGQAKDPAKEKALMPYQVNAKVLGMAKKDAVFMHCLPAHRGEEVTEDVIDSTHSIIFQEAENRLHVQKAVMCLLMGKK